MIFEPHARIQDVAQKVNILHTGQVLKAAGAIGQQQLKDLPHLFLVPGLSAQGAQGIVCALALVPGQVVVGIQQVDVLAQVEADAAQLRRPVVLLVVEQFGHQLAKAAGHGVQVLAAGGFVFCKPGQTAADGGTLPGPAGFGVGAAAGQQFFIAEAQQVVVILPFVLGIVVMQRHAQVGTVVGGAAVPPIYLPDGVDGAVAAAGDVLALTLVEAGKQQIQKRQIVTQRQTAPQAVERTDAAAEAAVGRAVAAPDTDDPGAVQPEGPGQGEGTGASQPEQDPGGGNGGASQSEPSQPGTEGESGGSDLPPEWLLPDVA